jgi:hypothetical protein
MKDDFPSKAARARPAARAAAPGLWTSLPKELARDLALLEGVKSIGELAQLPITSPEREAWSRIEAWSLKQLAEKRWRWWGGKLPGFDGPIDDFARRWRATATAVWHVPPDKVEEMSLPEMEDAYAEQVRERQELARSIASEMRDDPPLPRGAGGRPPKAFLARLAGYGAGWLAANGVPDTQAELERALHEECERREWSYSESQIRELAAEMVAEFRAALK